MNIFTELTSADSIYILLWLTGAFVIGIATGWSVWGFAKQSLEKEVKEWRVKYDSLQKEFVSLSSDFEEVNASIDKVKENYAANLKELQDFENVVNKLFAENQKLNEKLSEAEAANVINEEAKFESDLLKMKISSLETELNEAELQRNNLHEEISALKTELKKEIVNEAGEDKKLKLANTRISVLEGKIAGLNHHLKNTEAALENASIAISESFKAGMTAVQQKTNPQDTSNTATIIATVGAATPDERNDLTLINGIGNFLEIKLNTLGIYTFRQIANFDDAVITMITHAIEYFPDRIKQDNWVGQAKLLAESDATASALIEGVSNQISQSAAREKVVEILTNQFAEVQKEDKDDLKLINGIGPFIENELNGLGIYTYEQIGSFNEEMIELVTTAIAFFPGRIERDKWVQQAQSLMGSRSIES